MLALAATTPAPIDLRGTLSTILSSVVEGVVTAATSSPLVALLFAAVAVVVLVRLTRRVIHASMRRDPVRLFTRADKAVLLTRAGHRCEHHDVLFGGRCRAVEKLEADHIHPWSRGGWTALPNGQALCKRHNRSKRASIPYGWQLRRLERRRVGYFPPGATPSVTRRAPRTMRAAPPVQGRA